MQNFPRWLILEIKLSTWRYKTIGIKNSLGLCLMQQNKVLNRFLLSLMLERWVNPEPVVRFFKKRLQHRYVPVKFVKSIRIFFNKTPQVAASENHHPSFFFKKKVQIVCNSSRWIRNAIYFKNENKFQNFFSKIWIIFLYNRSSHRRCSVQKGVLRNFVKFTGKHLCQSLFFNKDVHFAKFVRLLLIQNYFHSLY